MTLTTDFGTRDHYVGAMRGVVARLAPLARLFDVTHEIPGFDIPEGAYAIASAWRCYPLGTIHVVVVDPGVGTSRRPIAVRGAGHCFVAPDNGVLSQVLEVSREFETRCIDARHGLEPLSKTFHGRDLFAPAAARLAAGLPFEQIGEPVRSPLRLPPTRVSNGVGTVLHVDSFGNVVTSFRESDLPEGAGLDLGGSIVCERLGSYAAASADRIFLIAGSSGYVEVSMNQGSAAARIGVAAGARVRLARPRRGLRDGSG